MEYNKTYRRKDKGWQYIISFKHNKKWRQRAKQGFETKALAKIAADERLDELKEEFKEEAKVELADGHDEMTLEKFFEIFINSRSMHRSENTLGAYETALKKFEKISIMKIGDITFADIQDCVNDMIKEGLAPRSIHLYVARIRAVFNSAAKHYKLIEENPVASDIMIPKIEKDRKVKALTKSELSTLLAGMKPEKYHIICLLASHCGLRLGEILGLCESDINFKTLELNVNKQWKLVEKGKYGFGKVKSNNRVIPIPSSIVKPLHNYLDTNVKNFDKRIFPDTNNSRVSNIISGKMRKMGFDITLHDLRHTYATMLIANRLDFKTVAELLGDTVQIVISTYAHVTDDMMDVATAKINQMF